MRLRALYSDLLGSKTNLEAEIARLQAELQELTAQLLELELYLNATTNASIPIP